MDQRRATAVRRLSILRRRGALAALVWVLAGCAGATGAPTRTSEPGPARLLALDMVRLELPQPAPDSRPIPVGIFLSTRQVAGDPPWNEAMAGALVRELVVDADAILAQCGLHLQLEAAEVVALPERLLDVEGNRRGSWGGHPPHDVQDVELFTYQEQERLTAETRELFAYGKQRTSPNAIAAYTVEHITYYIGDQREGAGGLSFPPNAYHHAGDYPLRNSVLLVGDHPDDGALPRRLSGHTLAHELGHMLLNSGSHAQDAANLMARGAELTPAQCERMEQNRARLFGAAAVPDPGPPTQN